MNLRRWSKNHTFGLLAGLLTPVIFVPLVILLYEISGLHIYWNLYVIKAKMISLACIPNLGWFHLMLKRKNYDFAMGVILATFFYLFVIIYYKYIVI